MAKTAPERRLIGDDLARLVGLLGDVDSVELKATVSEARRRSAVAALEMDPLDAQIRQVWFFDTPDLALDAAGVVVRARRTQAKPDDSVVKLRPVVPTELPESLRRSPGFVVEVDVLPGGFVCSGTLRFDHKGSKALDVASGDRTIDALFSKQQRAFYTEHAPEGLELNDLTPLGPVNVMKLKFHPTGYDRRMVAELWHYPDGSRILELSTKCAPAEALNVGIATRTFLESRGIDLNGEQQTKTRTALDLFARELSGA